VTFFGLASLLHWNYSRFSPVLEESQSGITGVAVGCLPITQPISSHCQSTPTPQKQLHGDTNPMKTQHNWHWCHKSAQAFTLYYQSQ